jgi:hypothetical protein
MLKGLTCASLLAFAALTAADDLQYLPVDQVRPGMQGYGLTVFRGTKRDRFTVTVRSVVPDFRGWPQVIVGEITGCPECTDGKHMLEHHQVYGGMSGSPLIVEVNGTPYGIAGLAMAKDFATTNKVLFTPIEYQFGMGARLPPHAAERTIAEIGDFTSTCLVYGDRDWCFDSTLTARRDGRLYTTSHDLPLSETSMLPYGDIALPVFLTSVAELLDSSSGATKLTGARLVPIGSAVVHGKSGFVVNEGPLPATVPVRLTVNGVFDRPRPYQFQMAYHGNAPEVLGQILVSVIRQLPDDPPATRVVVTIRLNQPNGVIRYVDAVSTGIQSLEGILGRLIIQEKKNLRVEGVDIEYAPITQDQLWRPVNIQTTGHGEDATLTVLARRLVDNETSQISEKVDAREIRQYRKKKPVWWDGPSLQNVILSRYPVRESFGLLAQIQERERLYLVYSESDDEMTIGKERTAGSWKQRLPVIRILAHPELGGSRFYLPPDKDNMVHAVDHVSR